MEEGKNNNDELAAMIKDGFDEMGRRFDIMQNILKNKKTIVKKSFDEHFINPVN